VEVKEGRRTIRGMKQSGSHRSGWLVFFGTVHVLPTNLLFAGIHDSRIIWYEIRISGNTFQVANPA